MTVCHTDEKNLKMFEKFNVYSKTELESRTEILLENYTKVINIEALTMIDMAKKQILPAVMKFTKEVCDTIISKKNVGLTCEAEEKLAKELSMNTESLSKELATLEEKLVSAKEIEDVPELSKYYRNEIFAQMQVMRTYADQLETIVSAEAWPFPTYSDLLFTV